MKCSYNIGQNIYKKQSDVAPDDAKAAGEAALDGGMIIATNEDNAQFPYIDAAPNNNPINEDYKTRNDFAASNTMVDWLSAMNDPAKIKPQPISSG